MERQVLFYLKKVKVFIFCSCCDSLEANTMILLTPLLCRAVISADLNQDGYGDLVVGAPGYSTLGRVQIGRVYVVYGNQSGLPPEDMNLDGKADQVLQGYQVRGQVRCLSFKCFCL